MINMVEQLTSKINREFDEQLRVMSERFLEQPVCVANQIAVMSIIRDAFKCGAEDIIKPLSLAEQGRLLRMDNLLLYLVKIYDMYAAEPEFIMKNFLESTLRDAEPSYKDCRAS